MKNKQLSSRVAGLNFFQMRASTTDVQKEAWCKFGIRSVKQEAEAILLHHLMTIF